jgi:hypothetical protein
MSAAAEISASELCEQAVARNPIDDYLHRSGIELKRGRCNCMIHSGDNPTGFAAWKKGGDSWRWKCHTGDCGGGDVLDLHVKLSGITGNSSKHARVLAAKQLLGLDGAAGEVQLATVRKPKRFIDDDPLDDDRHIPKWGHITKEDIRAISELRSIERRPLFIAARRRLLRVGDVYGHRCGIVTDSSYNCFLARRLDGKPWTDDHKDKTRIMARGKGSWPIGAPEAKSFPAIALCEGWGDFLAAFGHAWASGVEGLVATVCVPSATAMDTKALKYFHEKKVRIFYHNDDKGRAAATKWAEQLLGVAWRVDVFGFTRGWKQVNGEYVSDLNDLLRVSVDDWENDREAIESVMDFATEEF